MARLVLGTAPLTLCWFLGAMTISIQAAGQPRMARPPVRVTPSPMPFTFNQGMGAITMPFPFGPRIQPGFPYGGAPFYGQSFLGSSYNSPYRMMNPYGGAGFGGSGYGRGGGYGGSGGGHGGGGYGGGGYGGAAGNGGSGAASGYGGGGGGHDASSSGPTLATASGPNWLDSLGLPSEGGKLAWPLGLRVLAPANEVKQLRQCIDALLPILAAQAGRDAEDTAMMDEMDRALRRMRRLLAANGDGLAEATQTEARRFLADMRRAVNKMHY